MNRELAEFLAADARPEGTMIYPELAGFLFAVCSSPEMIGVDEWMPLVFNDQDPAFVNDQQGQAITGAIIELYNQINDQILDDQLTLPSFCSPVTPLLDNFGEESALAHWSRGFLDGHEWLCEVWEACLDDEADEELSSTLMVLLFFADRELAEQLAQSSMQQGVSIEQLAEMVVDNFDTAMGTYATIGRAIGKQLDAMPVEPVVREGEKTGRNDPCPCGSGMKYKKCCGK